MIFTVRFHSEVRLIDSFHNHNLIDYYNKIRKKVKSKFQYISRDLSDLFSFFTALLGCRNLANVRVSCEINPKILIKVKYFNREKGRNRGVRAFYADKLWTN